MAGPRRDQIRRGWNRGANGGWRGDDGWPDSRTRRSAGVHGASRGLAERSGGGDVGRNRPDEGLGGEESAGGIHAGSQAAEVAKVVVGEGDWSDDRDGEGGRGHEPTQADARHGGFARREATGTDEVDAHGVGAGKAVGSSAVGFGGWLGEAGKEIGVCVGRAFAVLQRVCERGEELQPALDAGVVLAYFGDVLERFVVRLDSEFCRPKVTA